MFQSQVASYLYGLGISYHSFGKVFCGKKHTHNFFKTDRITDKQREQLLSDIAGVSFGRSTAQYAPEIQNALIMIPTGKIRRPKYELKETKS